ncbi:MAG: alpha-hydroxy acid oxidase [Pseudomonadales bacterium]|nr:alpha-hydroxy acid oxidase [Pseudomonadales bacterium]
MPDFLTIHEIIRQAKRNLDQGSWDYLVGGADSESALRRNRAGVDSWVFKPRILNDVSEVDTASEFLGVPMRIPVIMPPIGSIQVFEEGGAASVAKAVQEFGIMQILSSVCSPAFDELPNIVDGPRIYQLYLVGDEAWMDDIIERTIAAGYKAFCLTADTQTYSRRERDILKRYVPLSGRIASGNDGGGGFQGGQSKMSWETVAHIKEKFDIPLIIKGVGVAEDAARCVEAGVDVVYVSNHGGRQLDHTRACIDALPEVAEAVDGRVPVVVDGGFMRGADVVKGLCLGADFIGMGRFEGLAMAAGGTEALLTALKILEHEIKTTMALAGINSLDQLTPSLVTREQPLAPPHVLGAFPFLAEGY